MRLFPLGVLVLLFSFSIMVGAQETSSSQVAPVSFSEYTVFLNAVAASDSHNLYNESMNGIVRSGESGSYHYEVVSGKENKPITFVTWLDAARYCNWKENGSPSSCQEASEVTETGSYTLNGLMTGSVVQNPEGHYVLPTIDNSNSSICVSKEQTYLWGANTIAGSNYVPIFHCTQPNIIFMGTYEATSFGEIFAQVVGFCVFNTGGGDQFNAASFLTLSQPGKKTWTVSDSAIGIIGALGLIGSGAGAYRYYRGRVTDEGVQPADAEVQQRQLAIERDQRSGEEVDEVDDILGTATNVSDFAPDQRSSFKQTADWLRGREHINSIYQDSDQIDYIEGVDPTPGSQTRFQKLTRWLTQKFYTYKNVADFQKRNLEYLNKKIGEHKDTIKTHKAIIAGHEAAGATYEQGHQEKDQTIEELRARIQVLETALAEHQEAIQGNEVNQNEIQGKHDRLRDEMASHLDLHKQLKENHDAAQQQLAAHAQEKTELSTQLEALEKKKKELEEELESNKQDLTSHKQEIESHKQTLAEKAQELAGHLEKATSHLFHFNKQKEEHQQSLQEAETKHKETLQEQIRQIEEQERALREQLQDDHKETKKGHLKTITGHLNQLMKLRAKINNHEQTQLQSQKEEVEACIERLKEFKKDQIGLADITKSIFEISDLEKLCYSKYHDSAFQMLREAAQYFVVKNLQHIKRAAKGSSRVENEDSAEDKIKAQHEALVTSYVALMEETKTLATKKELLWNRLAEMNSDFTNHEVIKEKIKSLTAKIPELKASIANHKKGVEESFQQIKKIFDSDQQSNATSESSSGNSTGSNVSVSSTPEKRKSGLAKLFHLGSGNKEALKQEATMHDLIEIAFRELGTRIEKHFQETINPITNKFEKLFVDSYDMLHLTEKNALLGYDLISLYEAEQGKKLWETSPLRNYLVTALNKARARVTKASEFLNNEQNIFIATWPALSREPNVNQELEHLKERAKNLDENKLNLLAQRISEATEMAQLLEAAKTSGETLLNSHMSQFKSNREAFLKAMQDLLSHPVLQ